MYDSKFGAKIWQLINLSLRLKQQSCMVLVSICMKLKTKIICNYKIKQFSSVFMNKITSDNLDCSYVPQSS